MLMEWLNNRFPSYQLSMTLFLERVEVSHQEVLNSCGVHVIHIFLPPLRFLLPLRFFSVTPFLTAAPFPKTTPFYTTTPLL